MQALLDAINTKFTTTTALTSAFPGGYSRERAPETTAMPYVVSTLIAAPSQAVYGTTRHSQPYIRFSAVGIGHDAILALIETFCGVFDDVILTLSSGQNYDSQRVTEPVSLLEPSTDSNNQEIWRWSVEYRFSVRQ
jgi:hypothetical protein